MEAEIKVMTIKELKQAIAALEEIPEVTEETKVFLDTGWDSLQEVAPDALSVEKAKQFKVQDELTKEYFTGYSLEDKAEKTKATGESETIVVLRNLY
ncbi:hypothetical protein BAU15_10850 [Enterococcus sp. JM4C]|uniref:hypothetical protein n=1 Tax=Candidatus Enterococcus huntleyi TaxID=1857217 RepID=UPI0013798C5E|nr:hypothetical protein [Enterococcus sp. JM4C]KAF1298618.1 hypothetical protein BAU15_10850 [Enterococcus sp. JM4C]